MKNITVITFETLCLFLVLGIASIPASVRRTRSDVFDWETQRYSWNAEKQMQDNSNIEYESSEESVSAYTEEIEVEKPDEGIVDGTRLVSSVLVERDLITFLNILEEAGLTKSFDSMTNVTLFVPTDEALAKPKTKAKLEELRANKDKLRDVLLFHVAETKLRKCDMVNDTKVKSGIADRYIRINKFTTGWYRETPRYRAECANILHFDNNCDETVHEIDGLLLPPTGSVYDIIQSDPKFSMLREVLKGTVLEETLNNTSPITFLAPANVAFKNLKATELLALRDKCYASAVLGQYVLPEMICSADMGRYEKGYSIIRYKTLHGSTVNVYADVGRVYIRRGLAGLRISPDDTQGGNVIDWEIMATNGIIHSVDKLMMIGDFVL